MCRLNITHLLSIIKLWRKRYHWIVLTLVESPSCMAIDRIQQCAYYVAPSRNHIVCLHKIKCNNCQHNSPISWITTTTTIKKHERKIFSAVFLICNCIQCKYEISNTTVVILIRKMQLTNQIWHKQEDILLFSVVSRHFSVI